MIEHTCAHCGKVYATTKDGGTAKLCLVCYARERRAREPRQPRDPNAGRRVIPTQLKWTPEEFEQLQRFHPDPWERADWIRELVRAELKYLTLKNAIATGEPPTNVDL